MLRVLDKKGKAMRLHGVWIIEDGIRSQGELFLWAEELKPQLPSKSRRLNIHPYAIPEEEILKSLNLTGVVHQETLFLPSWPSSPIPSSLMDVDINLERASLKE